MANPQTLLRWYAKLRSRTVDLVGDYAGDELFIIEGDSILLHSFLDDKLDFNPGFQQLHATYLVEQCLSALHQRKCNFHIVFFRENRTLCIPPGTPQNLEDRYRLSREGIIQHLLQNLCTAIPSIEVRVFDSYASRDFRDYLTECGAYFVMCHDGAIPGQESADESDGSHSDDGESDDSEALSSTTAEVEEDQGLLYDDLPVFINPSQHSIRFRTMIRWFIRSGYNIALVNGLECRDTKVMAMIVHQPTTNPEDSEGDADPPTPEESDSWSWAVTPEWLADGKLKTPQLLQEWSELLQSTPNADLSQRDVLTAVALSLMFKSGIVGTDDIPDAHVMLWHAVSLCDYRLADRAINAVNTESGRLFLDTFSEAALFLLTSDSSNMISSSGACDLSDLIDARLYYYLFESFRKTGAGFVSTSESMTAKFDALAALVARLCDVSLQMEVSEKSKSSTLTSSNKGPAKGKRRGKKEEAGAMVVSKKLLPFSSPVFDTHLAPIRLEIDKEAKPKASAKTMKIFTDLQRWRNLNRPLGRKAGRPMDEKQISRARRRNQFFMAEMRDYAASLTNTKGNLLEPETISLLSAKEKKFKGHPANNLNLLTSTNHFASTPAKPGKKGGGGAKPSTKDVIAATQHKKLTELISKQIQAWVNVRADLDRESDPRARFAKVSQYLATRQHDKRVMVEADILTYLLSILVEVWVAECGKGKRDESLHVAASIWDMVGRISKLEQGVSAEIASCIDKTLAALRLPSVELKVQTHWKHKLSFRYPSLEHRTASLGIGMSATDFQLIHAGPYFDRDMGSAPDERVRDFEPDEWQRAVLDGIDAKKSLFVVAPTSAGKTFISFYAMKQVLEEDDDGVLVYIAPTKALVNQVAAEVQARFSKSFKYPSKSVWGIWTRDFRINNPTGCQILVTTPDILQIMLLAPANADSWSCRIKRIIFDEIHCLGQADDGVVWEQLLLLSPCPIIALSATVGNPWEFSDWLQLAQKANGFELKTIEHRHRYSDLRKYVFNPPQKFFFNGFHHRPQFVAPGIDGALGLGFIHPVASLIQQSRILPDDLSLEARDCWLLWKALVKYQTADFPVDPALDPSVALPTIIRKVDIVSWEQNLKSLLKEWIKDPESPLRKVVNELRQPLQDARRPEMQTSSGRPKESDALEAVNKTSLFETTLPLICSLRDQGALPALFFNYDRSKCDELCENLLDKLEQAEEAWKATSPQWKAKLSGWNAWKDAQAKMSKKKAPNDSKKTKGDRDAGESKDDRARDSAATEYSAYESFDPEAPVEGFHLADVKKLQQSDFEKYVEELRRREIDERLIKALRRGVGVHHAGMNRKYRQVCEMLFRKGYLQVVFATGTLALGINMPCKTVVFSGDSIFLTALNFRQAAGRAGRRGFDVLGNVVFQGVTWDKVSRLMSSRLPDLKGHFPITTSLVLRVFGLLRGSNDSRHAVKIINSILSSPRIYLGGPSARDTVLHHLRFSIEYLRRNHLLDPSGAPVNFAACVANLSHHDNAGFAFHALLKSGYLHGLCKRINQSPKSVLLNLMLVMSHLFVHRTLPVSALDARVVTKKSASLVVLPPIPPAARTALRAHNQETLEIFTTYVRTFADQHVKEPDCMLPLTGMKCGGDTPFTATDQGTLDAQPSQRLNSAFVALSGHPDSWDSITDLCKMVRSGVWLEKAVVPYLGVYGEEAKTPLNAYLLDFFKHGNVQALEKENGIRKGDMWFLLNDFSLALAAIVRSLENLLNISEDDMLDVQGSGDAKEEEQDQAELDQVSGNPVGPPATSLLVRQQPVLKKKVVDSWDDENSDDAGSEEDQTENGTNEEAEDYAGDTSSRREDSELWTILKAFRMLKAEFDTKFKAMWA